MAERPGSGLLTAAEMRAAERAAMAAGRATGRELMERAGRGVVAAVFARWPALAAAPGRALVLCGPGNNGGDGLVVARLLHDWGWAVEVQMLGDPARLPPDARANCELWLERGPIAPLQPAAIAPGADLYVDALFGTGLARPLEGAALAAVRALAALGGLPRVVAVDLPSGLCSDSGRVLGAGDGAVRAALTVSFHALKRGHVLDAGPAFCGETVVAGIGLPRAPAEARLTAAPAGLGKAGAGHKYSHGHALVLAGGPGRGGAGRLAARAALRIGAGLVTLGCPGAALAENAAQLTAVMLREIGDAPALAAALEDARINALCLGPGLDPGAGTRALALAALASGRPTVLDAGALSSFAEDPAPLLAATAGRPAVLTPHGGEFARLFPDLAERLALPPEAGPAFSRIDAVREAAARADCALLLKGPDTVIAAPQGAIAVNAAIGERAAPWLATAGAGDVLAGLIAGLLARGWPPMRAAEDAAWLQVEAARSFGPGLIAEDLTEELPKVLRALGA